MWVCISPPGPAPPGKGESGCLAMRGCSGTMAGGGVEDAMGAATIGFGLALIVLGVGAYLGSGRESATALIPAFFGLALAICGGLAFKWPKPGVIAAMVVAALGLVGSLSRIVPALVGGEGFTLNLATG